MTHIIPVTGQLTVTMTQTHELIKSIDGRHARVNDKVQFASVIESLQKLLSAHLSALAVAPLTEEVTGPRYDADRIGRGGRVGFVAGYLRDATAVLKDPKNLSQYERKQTDAALSSLKALLDEIMSCIEDSAADDIRTARQQGPVELIAAARVVAGTILRAERDAEGNVIKAMPAGSHDHECGPAC